MNWDLVISKWLASSMATEEARQQAAAGGQEHLRRQNASRVAN
jgi:hypothetical protein